MALELLRVSASSSPAPGIRMLPVVTKLVDTTTCIGCKACEVACQEWNDLPPETTVQMGTYQTLPDLTESFWNLIRFREHEEQGALSWLMRKDQCMHCAEPGCLVACPAPGAIVQYTNGIVDFQQDQCIGCGYCMTGCPFNVPKFSRTTRRVYKCTMCVDRVAVGLQPACVKACPTSCLQFGTKDAMIEVANLRVAQLKANGFANAAVYDPPGVGGTNVVTVLAFGDRPDLYGLPANPVVPLAVRLWKGPLKVLGNFSMLAGLLVAGGHYLRFGPKDGPDRLEGQPAREPGEDRRLPAGRAIERYSLSERALHSVAGLSYVYLLLTGLAFWTPALYWMAAILGGGYLSRVFHPWIGLLFAGSVVWMFGAWRRDMRVTDDDRRWRRALGAYVRNEPGVPGAGRFNYGQKLLFWVMAGGGAALLLSGIMMWFVESVPADLQLLRYSAVLVHAAAALATIGAFIVHVYMGVAVVPGGLRAVIHGEVTEEWARRHHPLWLADVGGRAAPPERSGPRPGDSRT